MTTGLRINLLPGELINRETWLRFFVYSLFIFSTVSITGIELSVVLLYLLVIYHRVRTPSLEKLPLYVIAPFLMWVAVAVASAMVNPDPLENLASLRHQYRIFLPFALLIALGFVDLQRLLKVYLVFLFIISLYGIAQVFWTIELFRPAEVMPAFHTVVSAAGDIYYRARGNFSGPGAYANHMMMTGLLFLSLAFTKKNWFCSIWALGTVACLAGLIASFGRSAWLGTIVGLLVLVLGLPRRWSVPIIAGCVGALILFTGAVDSGLVNNVPKRNAHNPIVSRIFSTTTTERDAKLRLTYWNAGLKAIKRRPWLGYGFDNRSLQLFNWRTQRKLRKFIRLRRHSRIDLHNIYLQVGFDLGLIGLAAYLAMWAVIFYWNTAWIKRSTSEFLFEKRLLWGCSAALAAEIVDGFFHSTFFKGNSNTTILLFMGLSLYAGLRIRNGMGSRRQPV